MRQLAALEPPVGIKFETEGIYSLNPDAEMMLSFIATMAQEESHNKSEIMNASIEMRFRRGIFLTPTLLGYSHDEEGNLIINEQEAPIVKMIFFMYLYGYSCKEIADTLTRLSCSTKKGAERWSASTIREILQNERHCGDVRARKTYTPNFLDHKSKKNDHKVNQYYQKDHHEAIISRADFNAVQKKLQNAKFSTVSFLPSLQVIESGILKGFITIHPHWAGFTSSDYKQASRSVYNATDASSHIQDATYQAQEGEFDLRGYEVIRGQFFSQRNALAVTFSQQKIHFGIGALRKLPEAKYVELLIHPELKLLAVRPSTKQSKSAMLWRSLIKDNPTPKPIPGKAFLPAILDLLGWSEENRYRINGIKKEKDNDSFLLFHLDATEIAIPDSDDSVDNRDSSNKKQTTIAYPKDWDKHFGDEYYTQQRSVLNQENTSEWNSQLEGVKYDTEDISEVTAPEQIAAHIDELTNYLSKEPTHG